MAAENLWRVEIVNGNPGEEGGDIWHSINSQVRLVHVSTEQALKFSGKVYADWGFYQNEVVCDKQVLLPHLSDQDFVWDTQETIFM